MYQYEFDQAHRSGRHPVRKGIGLPENAMTGSGIISN
jgi:hypothetical protein